MLKEQTIIPEEPKQEASQDCESADLMLSGEMVLNMTDKHFEILQARAEMKSDLDNKTLMKKKVILKIQLADGTKIETYCNKLSQKVIAAKKGILLKNWIGFKGEFFVLDQMVGDKPKKVIYIKTE